MPILDWLNGKKTIIGAILFTLTQIAAFLTTQIPALQDLFNQLLGANHTAQVAAVANFLTQAFIYVGLFHKFVKSFFGLPDDPVAGKRGFGNTEGLVLLLAGSALLFGITACNKVPPNLSPTGAIAYRAVQVNEALTALTNSTKEAETRGLIQRNDAYKILDAVKLAATANNDLGTALQAGADATTAKAKAIAAIKDVLNRLPTQLSAEAQKVAAPYISAVLTILASIE
jgi:hypothetical protein